jgi:hypothetical protein
MPVLALAPGMSPFWLTGFVRTILTLPRRPPVGDSEGPVMAYRSLVF